METIQIYPGFTVAVDGYGYLRISCGCPECNDSVQPGHFACSPSPDFLLAAEKTGRVFRIYDDGRWQWRVADSRLRNLLRAE